MIVDYRRLPKADLVTGFFPLSPHGGSTLYFQSQVDSFSLNTRSEIEILTYSESMKHATQNKAFQDFH